MHGTVCCPFLHALLFLSPPRVSVAQCTHTSSRSLRIQINTPPSFHPKATLPTHGCSTHNCDMCGIHSRFMASPAHAFDRTSTHHTCDVHTSRYPCAPSPNATTSCAHRHRHNPYHAPAEHLRLPQTTSGSQTYHAVDSHRWHSSMEQFFISSQTPKHPMLQRQGTTCLEAFINTATAVELLQRMSAKLMHDGVRGCQPQHNFCSTRSNHL